MKFPLKHLGMAALLGIAITASAYAASHTSKVYFDKSGTRAVVDKGGTLDVRSGGSITGPAPANCGSTCTLTTANATQVTILDQVAGSIATLPAATGTGNVYKFLVGATTTSAADKVLTSPATDVIIGTAIGENSGTAKIFVGNASTYHSIQMPFSGSQPSGGFKGDYMTCTDVGSALWECNINYQAGATPTTPYSASTS